MTGVLLAATLSLSPVGETAIPSAWKDVPTQGLSGITRIAGDAYYAVRDSRGLLYSLTIGVDRTTGQVTNCLVTGTTRLAGRRDLECVAWDAARRCVWAGDEEDGSIRAFQPTTGAELARVDVPKIFDAFPFNFSFESLALRANGLEMWTCNEEALNHRAAVGREKRRADPVKPDTPDVDDGPQSTMGHGSRIRLQRFTRTDLQADWRAAGQWMYETDSLGGRRFIKGSRSGVADLLCLDDGTLLALEREMSVKKGGFLPSFRCRIYQIDFTGADDVSDCLSLKDVSCRPVAKKRLFGANTGFAMYEGICLGPELADGVRSVLLISDGDDGAANRILALRLTIEGKRK